MKGAEMAAGTGLIERFYNDVVTNGELGLIDELTADDFVDHEEGFPGQPPGKEGVRFFVNAMREAFPDLRPTTSEPTLVDGNLEAVHTVVKGTHNGDFMGISATGKPVEIEMIDIVRIENGKAAEHWGVTDIAGLMEQIGAMPATPA
jgi:predicted ester cyclase